MPVPSAAPADAGGTAAGEPPPPPGPPLPETLRESDFDNAACRLALFSWGVEYREIPPLADDDQRDCGIARPLEVTQILPGIALEGAAPMRCDTARSLARWMREIVVPAASHLPGAPRVIALTPGSTYQCRAVVGNGDGNRISEHALGNAIDIAAFTFDNGTRIEIAPVQDRGDLSVAFQNAVQGAACLFFTTVLGPGSNAAHDDHLHLDIKQRRGGFRLCQ
ncbi:extensin family protein [Paracoccus contaminans]|uniref:extensin-like domain-containing protein n=1 Tax=Paracoccus contaminans TaxID=1945662 RepID=UPI001F0B4628|nr:extensin family protein [Paracoccus contaminans]